MDDAVPEDVVAYLEPDPGAPETLLEGGNASGPVVRIGDTVRKPWEPHTARVHAYVAALAAAGIDVPRPLGRDSRGRQVLEFVPGASAMETMPLPTEVLVTAGRTVRRIHDASAGIRFDPADWDPLLPAPGPELLCHNDLAPWNLLLGDRTLFIDWDGAGPSSRLWDLAYSAQSFALLAPGQPVEEAAGRLRAVVVDGYGADAELRRALPAAMVARTAAMRDLLADAARTGRQPWARMHDEGHGAYWAGVVDYVRAGSASWTAALD